MKQIVNAVVAEINKCAKDIYKMKLICPFSFHDAKAGRFVNVYPKSKETLLARPLCISEADEKSITLVFARTGKGTREFATYEKGNSVRISTPLGNGFDIDNIGFNEEEKEKKNIFLLGGGIGTAPLVQLAKELNEAGYVKVFCIMGFKEEPFLANEIKKAGAQVMTALETKGQNVLDKYKEAEVLGEGRQKGMGIKADYAFACGPKPMLKALAVYFAKKDIPLQVSMEERMGCGYGACVGCVCRTKDGLKKVCIDGPVFMAKEVNWDE